MEHLLPQHQLEVTSSKFIALMAVMEIARLKSHKLFSIQLNTF
jgi:hypothetical protein